MESHGPINRDALQSFSELGSWRLVETTGDVRASSFLFQPTSIVVLRFNSILLDLLVTADQSRVYCQTLASSVLNSFTTRGFPLVKNNNNKQCSVCMMRTNWHAADYAVYGRLRWCGPGNVDRQNNSSFVFHHGHIFLRAACRKYITYRACVLVRWRHWRIRIKLFCQSKSTLETYHPAVIGNIVSARDIQGGLKKTGALCFVHINFVVYWRIFKLVSLSESEEQLQ